MSAYGSPIEALFAEAIDRYVYLDLDLAPAEFAVTPQAWLGTYRVDFLLVERVAEGFAQFPRDVVSRLVVECDGHDWHDRTREQAIRDRLRDRTLLAGGYPVVRFTGRELTRDAGACAEQAVESIAALSRLQVWGSPT